MPDILDQLDEDGFMKPLCNVEIRNDQLVLTTPTGMQIPGQTKLTITENIGEIPTATITLHVNIKHRK